MVLKQLHKIINIMQFLRFLTTFVFIYLQSLTGSAAYKQIGYFFGTENWQPLMSETRIALVTTESVPYATAGGFLFGANNGTKWTGIKLSQERTDNIFRAEEGQPGWNYCMWVSFITPIASKYYALLNGVYFDRGAKWSHFEWVMLGNGTMVFYVSTRDIKIAHTVTRKLFLDSSYNYICVVLITRQGVDPTKTMVEIFINGVLMKTTSRNVPVLITDVRITNTAYIGSNKGELPFRITLVAGHTDFRTGCCQPPGCSVGLCKQGGKCIPSYLGRPPYTCFCKGNYTGQNCERKIEDCRVKLCQNDGKCMITGGEHKCICRPGFAGDFCDVLATQEMEPEMSDLHILTKYSTVFPTEKLYYMFLAHDLGKNASFKVIYEVEGQYKVDLPPENDMPAPQFSKDLSILSGYEMPDDFKTNEFYYREFVHDFLIPATYILQVTGYTNGVMKRVTRGKITVLEIPIGFKIITKERAVPTETPFALMLSRTKGLPSDNCCTVNWLYESQNQSEKINFRYLTVNDSESRVLFDKYGKEFAVAKEGIYVFEKNFTLTSVGAVSIEAKIYDQENRLLDRAFLVLHTAKFASFFDVFPKTVEEFTGIKVFMAMVVGTELGTEPRFLWRIPPDAAFLAEDVRDMNCTRCIEIVLQEAKINKTDLPEAFYYWTYERLFGTPGKYEAIVKVFNWMMVSFEKRINITIYEPMSEIRLLRLRGATDTSMTFYLLVERRGEDPSFLWYFDGDVEQNMTEPLLPLTNEIVDMLKEKEQLEEYVTYPENAAYAVKDYEFGSTGDHTVRVIGSNMGKQTRTTLMTVNAFNAAVHVRLFLSEVVVTAGSPVYVAVAVKIKGDEPIFKLTVGDESPTRLKMLYSMTTDVLKEETALTTEDAEIYGRNGFHYSVLQRKMRSPGQVPVTLEVTNKEVPSFSGNATISVVQVLCNASVSVTNAGKDFFSLVQFPRNTPLLFGMESQINCDNRFVTIRKWTIHKIQKEQDLRDDVQLTPDSVVTLPFNISNDDVTFDIPKHILVIGNYVVKLALKLRQQQMITIVEGRGWFKIVSRVLHARINNGKKIHSAVSDTLIIDGSLPATESATNVTFQWFCSTKEPSPRICKGMRTPLPYTGQRLEFTPNDFIAGYSYIFKLVMRWDGDQSSTSAQLVYVNTDVSLSIECRLNCRVKVRPDELCIFAAICNPCQQLSFDWEVKSTQPAQMVMLQASESMKNLDDQEAVESRFDNVNEEDHERVFLLNDWSGNLSYGQALDLWKASHLSLGSYLQARNLDRNCFPKGIGNKSLHVAKGCLTPGVKYNVILTVSGPFKAKVVEYELETNTPPKMGVCEIHPKIGTTMVTRFATSCSGFEDEDIPLSYELIYENVEEERKIATKIPIKMGFAPHSEGLILPPGNQRSNYAVSIRVKVSDRFGASVDYWLNVTVYPNRNMSSIKDLVLSSVPSSFSDILHVEGDFEGALNMAKSVGKTLSSLSVEDMPYEDRTRLRQKLIDGIRAIPTTKFNGARAVISTLNILLEGDERELPTHVAELAANALTTATDDLVKSAPEDSLSTEMTMDAARIAFEAATKIISMRSAKDSIPSVLPEGDMKVEVTDETKRVCNISTKMFQVIHNVSDMVLKEIPAAEEDTSLVANGIRLFLRKVASQEEFDPLLGRRGEDSLRLPSLSAMGVNISERTQFEIKVIKLRFNPFKCSGDTEVLNTNIFMVYVEMSRQQQRQKELLELKGQEGDVLEYFVERRGVPEGVSSSISAIGFPEIRNQNIRVHRVPMKLANTSFHILIERASVNYSLLVTWTYERYPTIEDFNGTTLVVTPKDPSDHLMTFLGDSNMTSKDGTYFVGLLPYSDQILHLGRDDKDYAFDSEVTNPVLHYNITIFVSRCMSLNNEAWTDASCRVGNETTLAFVHCICTHLSILAGSFLVAPNTIDQSKLPELITSAKNNIIVIVTMTICWLFYLITLAWAFNCDRYDAKEKLLLCLDDNLSEDMFGYIVAFYTGIRMNAGTTSRVSIKIHGRSVISRERCITSKERTVLKTGGQDYFFLTTYKSLGEVVGISLVIHFEGPSPDWYLSQIRLKDVTTGKCWIFMVNEWYLAEDSEGKTEDFIAPLTYEQLRGFRMVIRRRAVNDLRERHLWFSVFKFPSRTQFSRVQRLSCAFSLLVLAMLINILLLGIVPDKDDWEIWRNKSWKDVFDEIFGKNYEPLVTGLQSSLMAYPFGLLMLEIFLRIKHPKLNEETQIRELIAFDVAAYSQNRGKTKELSLSSGESINEKESLEMPNRNSVKKPEGASYDFARTVWMDRLSNFKPAEENGLEPLEATTMVVDPKENKKTAPEICKADAMVRNLFEEWDYHYPRPMKSWMYFSPREIPVLLNDVTSETEKLMCKRLILPAWCGYIAVVFAIILAIICTFFIILYGLTYGYGKSLFWLKSNLFSIGGNIVFLDPLQVMIFAIIMTYCVELPERQI